ncbi:GNAT family N-acetyltransferase [Methanocella sp. MCL-LM]|uniref:GNAT family N-acetyltransferase n=1 Tax=Methanocella sp. MCL-LM TaxID=3412035 RepID=UPI003C72D845
MEVRMIGENKKQFLDLLLLADEQESMIDRYLGRGEMFALYDGDLKSICVVTREDEATCELKSLATYERYQGQGYASLLVRHILEHYKGSCETMIVGTGDSPWIIRFYESCGFTYSHRVKDFFTDNYDHPVFDGEVRLTDMVYLKKAL